MAKGISWSDFEADDSYFDDEEGQENEEQEENEEEQEESDEDEPGSKLKKPKKAKKVVAEEEEEEEEEEEPTPKKKGKSTPKDEGPDEEPEEENPDPDEEEEDEKSQTDEPDPIQFFEQVAKITGQPVDVEYGGVDPSSVEGFALREKAIREQALDNFLTELEEKFPTVFKALNHAYNGGDVADLFKQVTNRDYSKVELKEGDESTAKEILREYYRSKGVKNEARIAKMIEADEDSEGGLITEAKSALAEMAEEQAAERDKVLEEQKIKANEQKKRDQILLTAVDEVLEARKLGNFRIPDRVEAGEFRKFVLGNIRRTADNKYELAMPLDQGNLEQQLQYQYFQFKKGDLSKVIQQKAASENANKLKLRVQGEQSKQKKGSNDDSKKFASLKDFNT